MRISKKILSIVLAMLMLVSVCLVPSTAATALDGTEDAAKINVKYEVEQINSAWDGFLTTEGNDIYAVTVYAKAQYGINVLQVPLYFDADLFAPIMWMDDDPVNNGALGYDGWYADMEDGLVYDFVQGDAWSDTSWYRSTGATATSVGNARFIGLGNSNASVIQYQCEYVESTNTAKYDSYCTVPDDNFDGYMYLNFVNATSKSAYMNGIANAVVTDYVKYATIYFMRQDGVAAEDCIGAQFGWAEGGDWLTQTNWDTSGKPSYFASTYVSGSPGVQYVSNAVVEAAGKEYETSIVSYWKDQIRMDKDDYSEFSIRHLAQIKASDWEANFGTTEEAANATITDIGFILATGNGSFNKDDAANWLEAGATDNSFTKKPVSYVSTGMQDGYYVYSVIITGCTDKTASLSSLGYVVWEDAEGTTHYSYFEDVKTETFEELYDGYVAAH